MSRGRLAALSLLAVVGAATALPAGATQRDFIVIRTPAANSTVRQPFEFAGRTQPSAIVTVEAFTSDAVVVEETPVAPVAKRVRADKDGNFYVEIDVEHPKSYVHVVAQSLAPDGSSVKVTHAYAVKP